MDSPDILDNITVKPEALHLKPGVSLCVLLKAINLSWAKYHTWEKRFGQPNNHNGKIPRDFWLEDREIQAINDFFS